MMLSACVGNKIDNLPTEEPPNVIRSKTPSQILILRTPTIINIKENHFNTNPSPTPTESEPSKSISSPIIGISRDELSSIISNPFQFPGKGKDDGHPGLDFSFYSFHNWKSIENLGVASVLSGYISGVIIDRPPYGNAIMIESTMRDLDIEHQQLIKNLYPEFPLQDHIILNCPDAFNMGSNFSKDNISIYILYGHLKNIQDFQIGDFIKSGAIIGTVGNTGMSGNPHLHLETRIGPENSVFLKMAHYDNSITDEEKENYCLWRVSGYFFPLDPNIILSFQPTKP